jgi:hypothetical protein
MRAALRTDALAHETELRSSTKSAAEQVTVISRGTSVSASDSNSQLLIILYSACSRTTGSYMKRPEPWKDMGVRRDMIWTYILFGNEIAEHSTIGLFTDA